MKIKKYLLVLYFFALNLCAFGAEPNFINLNNILSGIWCRDYLFKDKPYKHKGIIFSVFYEFSPSIIVFQEFSTNGLNITTSSVLESGFLGPYSRPTRNLVSCYLYDEILNLYYGWNGYDIKQYRQFIVFEPKMRKLYSFKLTNENIERLKSNRRDGKNITELLEYADLVVDFDYDKADICFKRYQGNLIFGIKIPLQKPLEKIASSFDVRAYMNAIVRESNPGEMQNFRKRLISYLGECTLEFSGKRELRVYVNLSDCLSMTYYDRNIDSSLSNMNRTAIDLLAPNGISKEQERGEKYYYYVPFTKLRVRYAVNDSFLIYYTSEQWIKDNPESDFRNEKHAYIGKEDEDGNFIFYSGKEAAQDIKDLCNTNEYGHIISMKKDLEPRFKMKFGENEIIMWILRDGKWHQNFRMTRVLGGK